jgi:hypothetical protein
MITYASIYLRVSLKKQVFLVLKTRLIAYDPRSPQFRNEGVRRSNHRCGTTEINKLLAKHKQKHSAKNRAGQQSGQQPGARLVRMAKERQDEPKRARLSGNAELWAGPLPIMT